MDLSESDRAHEKNRQRLLLREANEERRRLRADLAKERIKSRSVQTIGVKSSVSWRRRLLHDFVVALLVAAGFGLALFVLESRRDDERLERELRTNLAVQLAIKDDLRGVILSGHDLRGIVLSGRDLTGSDLSFTNLFQADLSGADLSRTNLRGADLSQADLAGADLSEADLSGATLVGANLTEVSLVGARLSLADLSLTSLEWADLRGASLHSANLTGAHLIATDLTEANLSRADLTDADLLAAILTETTLTEAKLVRALLGQTDIAEANFRGADLSGADICSENLSLAKFAGADLSGTSCAERGRFERVVTIPGGQLLLQPGQVISFPLPENAPIDIGGSSIDWKDVTGSDPFTLNDGNTYCWADNDPPDHFPESLSSLSRPCDP